MTFKVGRTLIRLDSVLKVISFFNTYPIGNSNDQRSHFRANYWSERSQMTHHFGFCWLSAAVKELFTNGLVT